MDAYETSLNQLPAADLQFIRNHWMMFGETSFLTKRGRQWTVNEVRGGFKNAPLFKTKREAGAYATNLILAAARWAKQAA